MSLIFTLVHISYKIVATDYFCQNLLGDNMIAPQLLLVSWI